MHNKPKPSGMPESWLLLRGLTREAAHWGEFVPQLQAAFPDSRVHTLDLPGTGQFHQQASPSRIEDIVQQTRERAVENGLLDAPLNLIGLSLGGMVVWQWMKQFPQDVNSGVLINSSLASLNPFYQRLRWQSYAKFPALLASPTLYQQELAIADLVSSAEQTIRQNAAQQWAEIRQLRPLSLTTAYRQIKAAAQFRPDQTPPSQPVLIINSQNDKLVSPQCSAAISQQFGLELRTHPSAGHDLPLDDSPWLIEQIRNWKAVL